MEPELVDLMRDLASRIGAMEGADQVAALNLARMALHDASPFREEPVDLVLWLPAADIVANDYNPNTVAAPEMRLLRLSIEADGYTQPIVACRDDKGECCSVVDGFHRNRVGREPGEVRERLGGYLPVTLINPERNGRGDRIAATIRHNRARGKHGVEAMAAIVLELARRNWSDAKIGKELGMDPDEVLRLKQITGLREMFADREFSEAWGRSTSSGSNNRLTSSPDARPGTIPPGPAPALELGMDLLAD